MTRDTMASLRAELDALKASIAATPAAPSTARSHFTDRDIHCVAVPPCKRTDLRTMKRAGIHGVALGHDPRW